MPDDKDGGSKPMSDQEAMDALAAAQRLYAEYLQIVLVSSVLPKPVDPDYPVPTLKSPLTLVIKT